MNKKKSQEYLDKINESFEALSVNPHDIDVDTLLGYIRIFYSSVKSIPVQLEIEGNKIRKSITYTLPDSQPLITNENLVVDNAEDVILENNPEKITEEEVLEGFPSDSSSKEVSQEISTPEIIDTPEKEEITYQPQEIEKPQVQEVVTPIIEEEEVHKIEEVEAHKIVEKIKEPEQEIVEAPEINTVIPQAEKEEIAIHLTNDYIVEKNIEVIEDTPIIKPEVILELPNIKDDSKYGSKGNMLSQIETEQHKPLYTPNNQSSHNPSDAIESLFKDKSPTGLVDFLGLSPLDNINKAWGLNEKMLVIKDLFGDDFNAFNETIEMINKFTSFEEVKNYLINNVVHKYSWNDISKFKKASDFIVQTKRLFVK
ncbi:MAG: hypothetical protein WAU12_09450 [Saprospiraceae bacterium]|jgi:hypothetical protein|nr:hypothetical protein [Candidatus Brachybacter algidus]MBK8748047.1 hypothetical protein [Candidatus Brachybacter algidus]HQW72313.1 hypothetical protein [Saprospiraceae bacterium]